MDSANTRRLGDIYTDDTQRQSDGGAPPAKVGSIANLGNVTYYGGANSFHFLLSNDDPSGGWGFPNEAGGTYLYWVRITYTMAKITPTGA